LPLSRLTVHCVDPTARTEFPELQSSAIVGPILGCRVIPLLALSASQSGHYARWSSGHNRSPATG